MTTFLYRNWKGDTSWRTIRSIIEIYWGSNQWHTEPQWIMVATDVEKDSERSFALKDIIQWKNQDDWKILLCANWVPPKASIKHEINIDQLQDDKINSIIADVNKLRESQGSAPIDLLYSLMNLMMYFRESASQFESHLISENGRFHDRLVKACDILGKPWEKSCDWPVLYGGVNDYVCVDTVISALEDEIIRLRNKLEPVGDK